MHCFELKTTNLEFYVGGEEHNSSVEIKIENMKNCVWTKGEKNWKILIQHALMPVQSNPAS